jgi:hypothetical protein
MNEPTPFPLGVIQFSELPDHAKRRAAPDIAQGLQWGWYGKRVDAPDVNELNRWLPHARGFVANCGSKPSSSDNAFVGICGTDSATSLASASGNDSASEMLKIVKVCKYPKAGIQRLKRKRADILLAARADLSDRELARLAGVSHTYIAKRRRVATNAPTA